MDDIINDENDIEDFEDYINYYGLDEDYEDEKISDDDDIDTDIKELYF